MVKVLSSPLADVYGQMALDEAIVLDAALSGENICRFFNWRGGPYATFGYAQFYKSALASCEAAGIKDFTRRPTGGGLVYHIDDLTFSLFFNRGSELNARQIYEVLHGLIKENFKRAGVDFSSYEKESDYRPAHGGENSACFKNPVEGDLMAGGVKILGGAMRRYGSRILYQGSLQVSGARANPAYKTIIENAFAEFCGEAEIIRAELSPRTLEKARQSAVSVYESSAWKEKF